MARKYTPVGVGAVGVNPRARVAPGGPTFQRAQAQQAGAKPVSGRTGVFLKEAVSPELSFDSQALKDLQGSNLLDNYGRGGGKVTPFELGLDRSGMVDWINLFDEPDVGPQGGQATKYAPKEDASATEDPAPLSVIPTSTINPARPRTLGAGFEYNPGSKTEGKVTIMFRDGTLYNYYNVLFDDWMAFKAAPSKGQFIRNHKSFDNNASRGIAAGGPSGTRQTLHKAARVSQRTLHKQRPRSSGKHNVQIRRQTRRRK